MFTLLVLAFLALAVFSERAFLEQISDASSEALQRFRWSLQVSTVSGGIILLLTSLAQAA